MNKKNRTFLQRFQNYFLEVFGLGGPATFSIIALTVLVLSFSVWWFFHYAPPKTITISTGPEGSMFHSNANRYREFLKRQGITLNVVTSDGSLDNLNRLLSPKSGVDIAFVQSGVLRGSTNYKSIVSLGTIYYEPVFLFHNEKNITLISQLEGKRFAIGHEGSGTQRIALTLLSNNGIRESENNIFYNMEGEEAAQALLRDEVDAAFMLGDSASSATIRRLRSNPRLSLYDFVQADAYTRRNSFLNKIEIPQGVWDIGKNIPPHDMTMVGPAVDIVARKSFHPGLIDLIVEAEQEVQGRPGIYRKRGEFPKMQDNDFPISHDAASYLKDGKGILYRFLPFSLASLINRILVGFLPIIILLIPGFRLIPMFFKIRIDLRIQRWYRAIMLLEHDMSKPAQTETRADYIERLNEIEKAVDNLVVPASYAGQFYNLREHISFVKKRLLG